MEQLKNTLKDYPISSSIILAMGGVGVVFLKNEIVKQIQKNKDQNKKNKIKAGSNYNSVSKKNDKIVFDSTIPLEDHQPGDQIYKVCITGGPCGGKTSGLTYLQEKLQNLGYNVLNVPECATLVANAGGMLNMGNYTDEQQIQFQIQIMKTQMQLEQTFMKLARLSNQPTVVLCDRGLMDGSVYMSNRLWEEMLQQEYFIKNNIDETVIRDRQYDAVIHLVTAADGAEEYYNLENNEARSEDMVQALQLDRKLQLAWLGHPSYKIIDNHNKNFQQKLEMLYETVIGICGVKTFKRNQTKRKYLIDTKGDYIQVFIQYDFNIYKTLLQIEDLFAQIPNDIKQQKFIIEDTFVTYDKKQDNTALQIKIRKRQQYQGGEIYIWSKTEFTKQGKLTLKRMMNQKEYIHLLGRIDENRHTVNKIRTQFIYEGNQFQIDTYVNIKEGFSILTALCDKSNQELTLPEFLNIQREITNEPGYKSKYLSKKDWYIPQPDERIVNSRKKSQDYNF
ncbi:P-loop containing nucleoside triphosphate hydrolase [Pseudocohnilembus persalinus]|uniref:p-loop containing nucleoside triphosphate hydrolase n=1 Tax=Pseudocohnilembus persalinus TaxID=266149 RepID=A0A0V0R2F4_PSEPJ|nr:P-loop containing nucleoside triphosphate hydrolase [Pseudocohnilembus persalinus]|eukprot:KRX08694.1 P-loop containing nucleoside triphosphate hydrolase [Pseudocohnilembus persalinus]